MRCRRGFSGLCSRRRFRGALERPSAGDGWFGSAMSPLLRGRVSCAPLQAAAADSRLRAVRNSSWKGWLVSIAILMRRTLMRTHAAILSSLRRRLPHVASARWVWARPRRRHGAEQHISHRGEPQAELVGAHAVRRRAVGEQVELALLDAVLHIAALAIQVLVEAPGVVRAGGERGDDKARTGLVMDPFRLADDAAFAAPAVARGPHGVRGAVRPARRSPGCPSASATWRGSAAGSMPQIPA